MVAVLDGVEWIANPRNRGGTYAAGYPWRLVLHTTEAIPASVDGARKMAARHEYPPHLWAWPEHDWLAQTVPLDRSAFALKQPKGTPPTNKARALQVEIIGEAEDTPSWPDAWWDWIGRRIVRPVIDAGYPIRLDEVAATTGPDGYGVAGKVRMTWAVWKGFGGLAGHANVPGNSHWDIGAGDLQRVAVAAGAQPPEEDMAGTPGLVALPNGDLFNAGRGQDDKLWFKVGSGSWIVLNGQGGMPDSDLNSGPAAVLVNGKVIVRAVGGDDKMYEYQQNTAGVWTGAGAWTGPIGRGGLFA